LGQGATSGWPPDGADFVEARSKLRPVGYWRSDDDVAPSLPHPAALVDGDWDEAERAAVVDYLLRGFSARGCCGFSWCRLCDPDGLVGDNGSREFTDGTWIWPEGFSHYIEDHAVRPPADFSRGHWRTRTMR
jgi:hypothetical protein